MGTETEIQSQVLDALKLAWPAPGAWWHRNNTGRIRRRFISGLGTGSPDIVGCIDGLFVGVEIKVPGQWGSEDQECWRIQHELAGGIYVLAHSAQEALDGVSQAMQTARRVA